MYRRDFLRTAAAGAAGAIFAPTASAAATGAAVKTICIDEPFHGAVLNRRHGQEVPGGLRIRVAGRAPSGTVTVNGAPARRDGEKFSAEVLLREKETEIVAAHLAGGHKEEHRVRVRWDRHSFPRYRFSIDDNSFFLRDIAQKKYPSLFDGFYLKGLRDLHRKHGAKFVLNIYWTTGDGFELPQFPDRYKAEWRDNADWLRLAFHARADKPDRPYQDAPPEQLVADLDRVAAEIRRFAGDEVYSPPTVIHWAMLRPAAFKPLASRGVRVLSGMFERRGGQWDINYRLDDQRSAYLATHDALVDFDSGITFSKIDLICNLTPVEKTAPALEAVAKDPNQAEIMDLFTHEQYFWPFYARYIPDHFQRLDTAIGWVTARGYKPVFFHEGFLGAPE
jgi:hypothetical protein